MRTLVSVPLVAALIFGVLPATASATAGPAAAATDWRLAACLEESDSFAPITGDYAVVLEEVTRVKELRGVTITSARLDFSGVTCELFYAKGALPAGAEVKSSDYAVALYSNLIVGGVDQGVNAYSTSSGAGTGLYYGYFSDELPRNTKLFATKTYRPVETGVVPNEPGVPVEWAGEPYTQTYVRSEWGVTLRGKAMVKKTFKVTSATKAAAQRRLTRELRAATTDVRRREARKTYRLSLRGIRLVSKKFKNTYSGTLLP